MEPLHVYPVDDLREHELSEACWCRPTKTDDGIFCHNALDQRERYETGELKLN